MHPKVRILVAALFGFPAFAAATYFLPIGRVIASVERHWNKPAYRAEISKNAGITDGDSQEVIAEKITAHLHQMTLFTGKPWATTSDDAERYKQTLAHDVANMCATLASTEIWALGLFDIPARSVSFATEDYLNVSDISDTHTLVEAYVDGQDIAFDPTFSTTYSCEGSSDLLSGKALRQCAAKDRLVPREIAPPQPGRSVADYPVTFHELSAAIEATERPDAFYSLELPSKNWLQETRLKYSQ